MTSATRCMSACVCSHNPDVVERAVFRNVRIIRPAKEDFVPYRDYIGSQLEILDVATGHAQSCTAREQPFEAPNWTHDGGALIYNTSGARRRPRAPRTASTWRRRQSALIDTGFANRNNNDHVLSFDGDDARHQRPQPGAAAGRPSTRCRPPAARRSASRRNAVVSARLVARRQVSGLHRRPRTTSSTSTASRRRQRPGVQPHQRRRAGRRAGVHAGRTYIYFNSSRTGQDADLADGAGRRDAEQVTNDDFNNWFPHFSPDGQWIAFISFPKDVDAGRSPVLQARVSAPHARRGRRAASDRVCLRRPGDDQRAVVVAGRPHAGVREQFRPLQ